MQYKSRRVGRLESARKAAAKLRGCCTCPVERHAYNGCSDCGCAVRWSDHPDRHLDTTPEGRRAYQLAKETK